MLLKTSTPLASSISTFNQYIIIPPQNGVLGGYTDVCNSTDRTYFVKSTPPTAFSVSFQVCDSHIVDVHEAVSCQKIIFDNFTAY